MQTYFKISKEEEIWYKDPPATGEKRYFFYGKNG